MWEYKTSVAWNGDLVARLSSPGKPDLDFTPPPEFGGRDDYWSPEDLLVAAVESCILLTARFWMEKLSIDVRGYRSRGVGRMDRTANGLRFQGIDIVVSVDVGGEADAEKMRDAIEKTEKYCPVSQAVNCPVTVTLETSVAG